MAFMNSKTSVSGLDSTSQIVAETTSEWSFMKAKTGICKVCGEKPGRANIWQCKTCRIQVCAKCGSDDRAREDIYRNCATDMLKSGCWCRFPTQFNPNFRNKTPLPCPRSDAIRLAQMLRLKIDENDQPWMEFKSTLTEAQKDWVELVTKDFLKNQEHIVVVGAGVVGLFIALNLAKQGQQKSPVQKVYVVDINKGPCKLASGCRSGLLSGMGMDERVHDLAKLSSKLWDEIIQDEDFRQTVNYQKGALTLGTYDSGVESPVWFQRQDNEFLEVAEAQGLITSSKLGDWLLSRCRSLGVSFYFNSRVVDVHVGPYGMMQRVQLQVGPDMPLNVEKPDSSNIILQDIACTSLVIAGGPYSTQIVAELFQGNTVPLENYSRLSSWLELKVDYSSKADTAIVVPLPNEGDVSNRITFRTSTSENGSIITISGTSQPIPNDSTAMGYHDNFKHPKAEISQLMQLAARRLNAERLNLTQVITYSDQGAHLVSTGHNGLPVIGSVSAAALARCHPKEESPNLGVWLCYGFGDHGAFLAPAVGRVMSSLIHGDQPEVDTFDFEVSELPTSYQQDGPAEGTTAQDSDEGNGTGSDTGSDTGSESTLD